MNENQLRAFAIYLHNKFCPYNHGDYCFWPYEENNSGDDDWEGHAHKKWLKIAEEIHAAHDEMADSPLYKSPKCLACRKSYLRDPNDPCVCRYRCSNPNCGNPKLPEISTGK